MSSGGGRGEGLEGLEPPNNDIGGGSAPPNQKITGIVQLLFLAREIARVYLYRLPVPAHLYNDIQKSRRRVTARWGKGGPPSQLIIFIELVFLNRVSFFVHKYN